MNETYLDPHSTNIDVQLDLMVAMLKAASDLHRATRFPMLDVPTFGYTKAKKYARVFTHDGGQTFVCFFVQLDNGDVWKADGWKKPTLNFTRGNIGSVEGRAALIGDRLASSLFHFYGGIA